ncbi:FxSxx-COOH cyclophane-containing RiPP peptide [Microtetraspora niveoalba]|uniref:FxSxx-COOH cyclophane-containing RiPP peptide n=1 Tax=Microtetraspora niveoalba TaxID=46175 RepID=UPI00082C50A8|nr:FxSxx-COOH cyclophane-containing RiPP peptide [Microtetraspora niveoalba]
MNAVEEIPSEITSELKDLRHVALSEVQEYGGADLGDMLRRVLPDSPDTRVGVAAFQSSI